MIAAGAAAFVVAVLVASASPGPRAWGLHLPGFLPGPERAFVVGLMVIGVIVLAAGATGPAAAPSPPKAPGAGAARRSKTHPTWRRWIWIAALPAYAAALYALRERSFFLGDGLVWIEALRGGEEHPYSAPLSSAVWHGFVAITQRMGMPLDVSTFAILPVLCGVAFAAIGWGVAGETLSERPLRPLGWALLTTAGFTQLYFGYMESYPVSSVAIFAYLWVGLRRLRGVDPPWLPGAVLSLAIAFHLISLYLLPSYLLLVALDRGNFSRKAGLALIPFAAAPALLLLAGTRPEQWMLPFRTAAQGAALERATSNLARPYGAVSLGHAWDVTNAVLLAVPAAMLVVIAWIAARRRRLLPTSERARFLATAAVSGIVASAAVNLAVAPAQDWDLSATLLLPMAIAGVAALGSLFSGQRARLAGAGLAALSLGALLAFVLVNADEASGIARYQRLLGEGSRITPFGRAYGYSMLAEFYEDRKDHQSALGYARAALAAEPTNPRYWIKVGTALYNLGRFEEAIPPLAEAARRGPDRADGRHNLGLCYARVGRVPEALSEFRAAVARDRDRPEYLHDLGAGFAMAGELDSARVVWREVLRRWPDFEITRRTYERRFGPPPANP